MALLKTRWGLLGLLSVSACADTEDLGHANGWLQACSGAAPCASTNSEPFGVQAYFDTSVSRYAPRGFYAYFELERDDGPRGVLELDVPFDSGSESVSAEHVSYRELDGDRIRFESKQVVGEVQLPRPLVQTDAYTCGCEDGLFNLRFTAPGTDGELGTPDDLTRELFYGHLSRGDEPCGQQLARKDDDSLRVQVRECSPPPAAAAPVMRAVDSTPPERRSTHSSTVCNYPGCYREDGSYTVVESGCGGSTYNDSGCGGTSEDQTGGCGGSDTASSESSGCGDSSSSDDDEDDHNESSGCEGDTSNASSSSSCSTARVYHRDLRAFMGTGLPLLLVCAWQARRSRRLASS